MTLPTFLGIGASRSGTTWLYELLKSHPQIDVPPQVKEVNYFGNNYDEGLDWYESFFRANFEHHGEITPTYMYNERIAERVKKDLDSPKFIVLLRDPIERLISVFKKNVMTGRVPEQSFESFVTNHRVFVEHSEYMARLEPWLKRFSKHQIQVLLFENVMDNPNACVRTLASFLDVEASRFSVPDEKVNSSFQPPFPKLYKAGIKLNDYLVARDLYFLSSLLQKGGDLFRAVSSKNQGVAIPTSTKEQLLDHYEHDMVDLQSTFDLNLSDHWESARTVDL